MTAGKGLLLHNRYRPISASYLFKSFNCFVSEGIPSAREQIGNNVIPALAEHGRLYDVDFKLRLLASLKGKNSRCCILVATNEARYTRQHGAVPEPRK